MRASSSTPVSGRPTPSSKEASAGCAKPLSHASSHQCCTRANVDRESAIVVVVAVAVAGECEEEEEEEKEEENIDDWVGRLARVKLAAAMEAVKVMSA